MTRARTVAFYSYKGGTGRTLALANIARFAGSIGKRVIVIDMDLEAPGLTYKLLPGEGAARNRGLVGCLLDSIHAAEVPPDLGDYLIDVQLDPQMIAPGKHAGWVKLMPAGNVPSPNYFGELRRLALDTRISDGSATELLSALIDRLSADLAPDVILIDARTGITNTNTLVLSELADDVFAFFLDLREQLDGVRMVLRSLAPLTREADRPLRLHGVISRVPVESEHRVPVESEHRSPGWSVTDRDRERTERIERFFTEPSALPSYSVDEITLFSLHHEPALVEREHLLLDQLLDPTDAVSPLAWDYLRVAAAVLDDPTVLDDAVAHLAESSERQSWAAAAVIADNPTLPAMPSIRVEVDPTRDGPLRDRIDALRRGAEHDPKTRAPLAALLLELASAELAIGNRGNAIAPTEEAVNIYEELAAADPEFLEHLATSLMILAYRYGDLGERVLAIAPTERAVNIYEQLAATDPTTFRGSLAGSLNNLGARYFQTRRWHEAFAWTERAVDLYEELSTTDPVYLNQFAMSLNNLGNSCSELRDYDRAVAHTEHAVKIHEELAASDPAYLGDLGASLSNLGIRYRQIARHADAVAPTERAVKIYEGLARSNPAFRHQLAVSLSNLGNRYGQANQKAEAVASSERGVEIYEELAQANPALVGELAGALTNLGNFYEEVGRHNDAVSATRRAAQIHDALARGNFPADVLEHDRGTDEAAALRARAGAITAT